MKFLVFLVAVVALVSAEEQKPAADKPRLDDKPHLVWPLPDPVSEGDLMLHGSINYDRVRDLHKAKLEEDVDKMILAHGRVFLRRVSKFLDEHVDFKVMPILCRDSRKLNATENRWDIEIPKVQQAAAPVESKDKPQQAVPVQQHDSPVPNANNAQDEPRNNFTSSNETFSNETVSNETTTTVQPSSSDKPSSEKPSSEKPSSTTDRPADLSTSAKPAIERPEPEKDTYEVRRREFYRRVGENFARLLMKEYRKESMIQEETEYLARWVSDEAVHYGAVAIYCNEGENVKEIKKNLVAYLEEKAQ